MGARLDRWAVVVRSWLLLPFLATPASAGDHVSFVGRNDIVVPNGSFAVAVADLDGDGHADLAALGQDHFGGTITILIGRGDATFAVAGDVAVGGSPSAIIASDFDGDGHEDLAVEDVGTDPAAGAANLVIWLGHGDGTFRRGPGLPLGDPVHLIAADDFDGDGRPDIVVEQYVPGSNPRHARVFLLFNRGDGVLDVGPTVFEEGENEFRGTVVGDLDGDGILDLVIGTQEMPIGGPTVAKLSALVGHGDGTFGAPIVTDLPDSGTPIGIGDFDADGRADVGTVDPYGFAVLVGSGTGTFPTRLAIDVGGYGGIVADIDGDGRADAVVSGRDGLLSIVLAREGGRFDVVPYVPTAGDLPMLVAAEVNGDGHLDLVTAKDVISILPGRGDGTFVQAPEMQVGASPHSIVTADFDGDGALDLATTSSDAVLGTGSISVLLGLEGGRFSSAMVIADGLPDVVFDPGPLVAADFDGDGHTDLAVEGVSHDWLVVLLGHGDGTFERTPTIVVPRPPSRGDRRVHDAMAVGDFDRDGHVDLATTSWDAEAPEAFPSRVVILLGRGDGTLHIASTLAVGPIAQSIVAADFDADGLADLATANVTPNFNDTVFSGVSVLVGRGDATFRRLADEGVPSLFPETLSVADFDEDGYEDIAVGGETILLLHGRGDGTFTRSNVPDDPVRQPGGLRSGLLASGDFDGDGHRDLATLEGNDVVVLLGQGDGTFVTAPFRFGVGVLPRFFTVGDFDRDGRPDIATVNAADGREGSVSILLNTPEPSPPTTTTPPSSTTSSTTPSSYTTTTTSPPEPCATVSTAPTFASTRCQLDALGARATELRTKGVSNAASRLDDAARLCRAGATSRARRQLAAVGRRLRAWAAHLAQARRRHGAQRRDLAMFARNVARDVRRLRHGLRCPQDAPDTPTR